MLTSDNLSLLKQLIDSNSNKSTMEEYFINVHEIIKGEVYTVEQLMRIAVKQVEFANNVIETEETITTPTVQGPVEINKENAQSILEEGLLMVAAIYVYATQTDSDTKGFLRIPGEFFYRGTTSYNIKANFLNKLSSFSLALVAKEEEQDKENRTYDSLLKDLDKMIFWRGSSFPEEGNPNIFYQLVDTFDKKVYYFDTNNKKYVVDKLLTDFNNEFNGAIKIQYKAFEALIEAIKENESGVNTMILDGAKLFDQNETLSSLLQSSIDFNAAAKIVQMPFRNTTLVKPLIGMLHDWSSILKNDVDVLLKAVKAFSIIQKTKKSYFILPTGKILDGLNFFAPTSRSNRFNMAEMFMGALIVLASKGQAQKFVDISEINTSVGQINSLYQEFLNEVVDQFASEFKLEPDSLGSFSNVDEKELEETFNEFPEMLTDLKKNSMIKKSIENFNQRSQLLEINENITVKVRGW